MGNMVHGEREAQKNELCSLMLDMCKYYATSELPQPKRAEEISPPTPHHERE